MLTRVIDNLDYMKRKMQAKIREIELDIDTLDRQIEELKKVEEQIKC